MMDGAITGETVRLIIDDKNEVVPTREALKRAQDAGLNLIAVAPEANPIVVKMMNYHKEQYKKRQNHKEAKQKQKKMSSGR